MLNFAWDQERALEVRAEEAMENLQCPPEKAMDALSVPTSERGRYKAML